MASVKLVSEEEADDRVKAIYDRIKASLGIDFVPNMFKAMAHRPDLLEVNWTKSEAVMGPGKLDRLTKEIIAVAVSAVSGCEY